MLGTKWPSITSMCTIVPPPSRAACASLANCAKFAERIDGASSIFLVTVSLHPHWQSNFTSKLLNLGQLCKSADIRTVRPWQLLAQAAAFLSEFDRAHH